MRDGAGAAVSSTTRGVKSQKSRCSYHDRCGCAIPPVHILPPRMGGMERERWRARSVQTCGVVWGGDRRKYRKRGERDMGDRGSDQLIELLLLFEVLAGHAIHPGHVGAGRTVA